MRVSPTPTSGCGWTSDMTETDISGAMSDSYVLAADDNGKQVKVKVGFTDDGNTDEGPLTSAAYPSGTTVGTNTAPASADKTVTTAMRTRRTRSRYRTSPSPTRTAGDALVSVTVVTLPSSGDAGARRHDGDDGPGGYGGRAWRPGVHAGAERERNRLCEFHVQGERRGVGERSVHADGERDGAERCGDGPAVDYGDGVGRAGR